MSTLLELFHQTYAVSSLTYCIYKIKMRWTKQTNLHARYTDRNNYLGMLIKYKLDFICIPKCLDVDEQYNNRNALSLKTKDSIVCRRNQFSTV